MLLGPFIIARELISPQNHFIKANPILPIFLDSPEREPNYKLINQNRGAFYAVNITIHS